MGRLWLVVETWWSLALSLPGVIPDVLLYVESALKIAKTPSARDLTICFLLSLAVGRTPFRRMGEVTKVLSCYLSSCEQRPSPLLSSTRPHPEKCLLTPWFTIYRPLKDGFYLFHSGRLGWGDQGLVSTLCHWYEALG